MPADQYTIQWLKPADATKAAAVEASVHTKNHRLGRELIWAQLQETEADGHNLSIGLYYRSRLVGFGLAFVMHNRLEMADFFDAPIPPELNQEEPIIYIADFAILPRHRRWSILMASKFASIVRTRNDLRTLSMDAFSTDEYAKKWRDLSKLIAKLGWRKKGSFPFQDSRLGERLCWLQFERLKSNNIENVDDASGSPLKLEMVIEDQPNNLTVGLLRSINDFAKLKPYWDDLQSGANDLPPNCTWEYLRSWYVHFGTLTAPIIIVAISEGRPVAAIPLQVRFKSSWRQGFEHHLTFPSEAARAQPFLIPRSDNAAVHLILRYLATPNSLWQSMELCFPSSSHDQVTALEAQIRRTNHPVYSHKGPTTHHISIQGSWIEYLQSRSPTLQRTYASHRLKLGELGSLRFEIVPAERDDALSRYIALEQLAPDDEIGMGASVSSQQIAFYREVANSDCERLKMMVGFLFAGAKIIAGVIGFALHNTIHLVHLTRIKDHASSESGLVTLGILIEHCHIHRICSSIALPTLTYAGTAHWSTDISTTRVLRVESTGLLGQLRHVRNLLCKPGSADTSTATNSLPTLLVAKDSPP